MQREGTWSRIGVNVLVAAFTAVVVSTIGVVTKQPVLEERIGNLSASVAKLEANLTKRLDTIDEALRKP